MRPALLLSLLLLTACAYTPQVTVLLGPRDAEQDTELAGTLMVLQPFGPRRHGVCGYAHSSEVRNGHPFNRNEEITFDQAACGWQWGGRDRR